MNTKKNATLVLCFGDSNTRGSRPDSDERYPADSRWTGCLQNLLGDDYYVIEEGLGGRTTGFNDPRENGETDRNGLVYFKPCLRSHYPVDVVVIMLSTNDFKNIQNVTVSQSVGKIREYCHYIKSNDESTKVILVSPAPITPVPPIDLYDEESEEKSKHFPQKLQDMAAEEGAIFVDAGEVVQTGGDGLHWTEESNERFAELLKMKIVEAVS